MVALLIQAFEHLSVCLRVGQGVPQISLGHVVSSLKLIFYARDAMLFSASRNIYH
jgi:hypothetical protein